MAKWSLNAKTQTPPHSPQGHEHGRNDVMWGEGAGRRKQTHQLNQKKQFAGEALIQPNTASRDMRWTFISPTNAIQKQLSLRGKKKKTNNSFQGAPG